MTATVNGGLDPATAELLASSLREVLTAHPDGTGLTAALEELGWAEVVADDLATATTLLFVEHGRALATSRALDAIVLRELDAHLPEPAGPRAVLYSHGRHHVLFGPLDGMAEVVALDQVGQVRVVATDQLEVRPVRGFDPGAGWLLAGDPGASPVPVGDAGTRAVAAARRALTAEIIGTCEAALELAVAHTASRVQYGRQIATFQAVRHRLSESHVEIEAARALLTAAWTTGSSRAARLAKLRAGQAQAQTMRHAVQVHGAMGLSYEGQVHGYVTRAAALDLVLGGHQALSAETGAELLAGADLDPIVEI